ncbi:MAG: alginate export family protein [Thermoanaerobaculia bacterium]
MRRRLTIVCCLFLVFASFASAQELKVAGSLRVRAESWSFFEPPANVAAESDYTFFGALLRAGVSQQRKSFDWQVEAAVPALFSLPDQAAVAAPYGQLGLGGTYRAANDDGNAIGFTVKQAFARFKWTNDTVRVGRFEFAEGTEVAPKNAMLAAVKSSRVAQRLIGPFAFSHVGRSFDGVSYAHNAAPWNFTAAAFRPTSGAFKVPGGDSLDVNVAYGAFTFSRPNADERLFVIAYDDRRDVLKTDNRTPSARAADRDDVNVITLGGHYVAAFGNTDLLAWGAIQTGEWGTLDHKAGALALEAGYHWPGAMKPVLRGGIFRSSGDGNRDDGDHETFFQVLPTPRLYARNPFYNAMNSTDVFVQGSFKPTAKVTVASELHQLGLTESADLWYAGGGAFEDRSFGFAGRPANGDDALAHAIDVSVDVAVSPKMSFAAYAGFVRGGDVVENIFEGENLRFVYLEFTRRF